MSITSRAITTFVALSLAATTAGNLPVLAVANSNSLTRGSSETAKANAENKKSNNQASPNSNSKSLSAQQSSCNKVRASIANRTANLQDAGERHLAVIDKVYLNLTDFNGKQGLQLSQADQDRVSAARAQAEEMIFTLGQNEDKLSCEDKNVGQMAATVRLSVQNVSDSLKEYRESVGSAIEHIRQQLGKEGQA